MAKKHRGPGGGAARRRPIGDLTRVTDFPFAVDLAGATAQIRSCRSCGQPRDELTPDEAEQWILDYGHKDAGELIEKARTDGGSLLVCATCDEISYMSGWQGSGF